MPWWWILLGVSGAVAGIAALFYATLLLRATWSRRVRTTLDPAFELDTESAKHAAESLAALIRFKTVSHRNPAENEYNEWVKLRDYLRKRYPGVHNTLSREIVGDYSLLYRWEAADPVGDPILLCGHLDVVPADGAWEHPPFAGAAHDGYIWGRGALDCKGVVVSILEAVEALINRGAAPVRDIYLAFGHDHESGGRQGAASMARLFAERDLQFYMVLDEGGWLSRGTLPLRLPVAQVAVAEKGHMTVALSVSDPGGHAASPPAHTAAGLLSEAVARIEYAQRRPSLTPLVRAQLSHVCGDLPFRWRYALVNLPFTARRALKLCARDEKLNALIRTTFAVTQMESGRASNMLPQSAQARVDVRLLHGDACDDALSFISDLVSDLGVDASALERAEPSAVSGHTTPQFDMIRKCVRGVFGNIQVTPALLTSSSDARRYEQNCGQIFRFSPFVLTPLDQNRLHAADEGVRTDSMGLAVCFYRELLLSAACAEQRDAQPSRSLAGSVI